MNRVCIIGNLCSDPEVKTTQSGKLVTSFTVAVYRTREITDFLRVTAWEGSAELIGKYAHKGGRIGVDGSIQSRSYTGPDGEKRTATEIVASRVDLLGTKLPGVEAEPPGQDFTPVEAGGDLPF